MSAWEVAEVQLGSSVVNMTSPVCTVTTATSSGSIGGRLCCGGMVAICK
ncbi:MAG: hypothetical protein JRJ37_06710 [Deltaproteobacteria bacterium]|nr:hypothetical protein [Deltaproteobacteria bacterium]